MVDAHHPPNARTLPEAVEDAIAELHAAAALGSRAEVDALCARFPEFAAGIRETVAALQHLDGKGHPDRIGPYRLLGVLGEGGMGTVYLGEQRQPVRRRVAVKVVKLGMDSKAVLVRFEAERQALAMMEHSCIARVLDAGITGTGQPYFAMEYVKGIPITDYCDRNKLPLEERIHLFRQVCAGVQHAHAKGVVHRDIKPSNVLVTLQDGNPRPKIIDFGLAKAMDHRLVESTVVTEIGQILGTPEYMSPEQAGHDALDVDTRTDVYSLGVMLYELLTGELPFSKRDLQRAGFHEMQRILKETDPPKPSTRVTTRNEAATDHAKVRGVEVGELGRELRGDLDWIVMKALEKDRTRRYETPMELAADLERHLQHVPVLAAKPSFGYRATKFLRRNRMPVVAGGCVVIALLFGGFVFLRGQYETERQRQLLAQRDREIDQFTGMVLLQKAREEEPKLCPPWPVTIPRFEAWFESDYNRPLQLRPMVEASLAELRAGAQVREAGANGSGGRLVFSDPQVQLRHDMLERLVTEIDGLVELGDKVQQRLQWAKRIRQLTTANAGGRSWAEARAAIAAADGKLASERYREVPIDLAPQMGLVPIGKNPVTGLWEFYELRSAWDPTRMADPREIPIPVHAKDGTIQVTEHTGIVFVLVPGGTLAMGAPPEDPLAMPQEQPVTHVRLAPFFLARHEITQGQWRRLSGGEEPSRYRPDNKDFPIDLRHPVENVPWTACEALLRCEGLTLPTEAQWEWGCRAGTTTRWWTGDDEDSLEGAANLLDQYAKRNSSWTGVFVAWEDGWVVSAPVGSFLANSFGLHDVHGNVDEWCLDAYGLYGEPHREGDGLRHVGDAMGYRPWRGGSFGDQVNLSRASARGSFAPGQTYRFLGARAARAVHRDF